MFLKCTGKLRLRPEPKRDKNAQGEAGEPDREPKDQGGHIIAKRFGGPPYEINHIAQDGNFNNSRWRTVGQRH